MRSVTFPSRVSPDTRFLIQKKNVCIRRHGKTDAQIERDLANPQNTKVVSKTSVLLLYFPFPPLACLSFLSAAIPLQFITRLSRAKEATYLVSIRHLVFFSPFLSFSEFRERGHQPVQGVPPHSRNSLQLSHRGDAKLPLPFCGRTGKRKARHVRVREVPTRDDPPLPTKLRRVHACTLLFLPSSLPPSFVLADSKCVRAACGPLTRTRTLQRHARRHLFFVLAAGLLQLNECKLHLVSVA